MPTNPDTTPDVCPTPSCWTCEMACGKRNDGRDRAALGKCSDFHATPSPAPSGDDLWEQTRGITAPSADVFEGALDELRHTLICGGYWGNQASTALTTIEQYVATLREQVERLTEERDEERMVAKVLASDVFHQIRMRGKNHLDYDIETAEEPEIEAAARRAVRAALTDREG